MLKKNMTEKQLAERKLFQDKLSAVGWDLGGWDEIFESGVIDLSPEAHAVFTNAMANLELDYHAAEEYVSLVIGAKESQDHVKYRFYYRSRLEEVLNAIISVQNTLARDGYLEFIKVMIELCDVMMELGGGGLVRLTR